jgi:hypothetical protein
VTAVRLSDEGRTAFLTIADLKPVNQMQLKIKPDAADGSGFDELVYLTINKVPSD